MLLENKVITLGITSAFYAIEKTIPKIKTLITAGAEILPVMSFNLYNSQKFINEIEKTTGTSVLHTIDKAEQIGSKIPSDIMAIVPCTGNTIGKLANGIIDTPVLVAAKTNLKVGNNLVIGIATNDGLSIQAENIGKLLKQKNIFFIPFRQNNPITKPNSLSFSSYYIKETIEKALDNEQMQPILI